MADSEYYAIAEGRYRGKRYPGFTGGEIDETSGNLVPVSVLDNPLSTKKTDLASQEYEVEDYGTSKPIESYLVNAAGGWVGSTGGSAAGQTLENGGTLGEAWTSAKDAVSNGISGVEKGISDFRISDIFGGASSAAEGTAGSTATGLGAQSLGEGGTIGGFADTGHSVATQALGEGGGSAVGGGLGSATGESLGTAAGTIGEEIGTVSSGGIVGGFADTGHSVATSAAGGESVASGGSGIGSAAGAGIGAGVITAGIGLLSGQKTSAALREGAYTGLGTYAGAQVGAAIGSVVPVIGTAVGAFVGGIIGSVFCFAAGTPILMADRTIKPVESIRRGDETLLGGRVVARGEADADELFFYKNTTVARGHAVFEDGRWLRVEQSKLAVPVPTENVAEVYPVATENMLLVTPWFIAADAEEVDNTQAGYTDEDRIDILNGDVRRNVWLAEAEKELCHDAA